MPLKEGQVGYLVKLSCILELELNFDDELIQLSVEGTTATTTKKQSMFSPSGCNQVESFPFIRLAAKQLY